MPILTKLGLTVEVLSLVGLVIIILIYSRFRAGVNSRKDIRKIFIPETGDYTGLKRTTHNKNQDYSRTLQGSSTNPVLGKYRKHTLKKTSIFINKQRTWQEFREALRRLSD